MYDEIKGPTSTTLLSDHRSTLIFFDTAGDFVNPTLKNEEC